MIKWIAAGLLVGTLLAACSPNNVTVDDSLKKIFDANKVTGCFGLFDNGQGRFTIYNLPRFSDSAYLPASTFKIVNSLIGVETGAVQDTNSVIPWDTTKVFSCPECNADLTMYQAFRLSCVPWYRELARRIGVQQMQKKLDTLGYGQHDKKKSTSAKTSTAFGWTTA